MAVVQAVGSMAEGAESGVVAGNKAEVAGFGVAGQWELQQVGDHKVYKWFCR